MDASDDYARSFGLIRSPIMNYTKNRKAEHHQGDYAQRRLRWLGHVLRMEQDHITNVALRWTPPGKRKPGRPKTTWRRTVTQELEQMNLSWGEAQHAARESHLRNIRLIYTFYSLSVWGDPRVYLLLT